MVLIGDAYQSDPTEVSVHGGERAIQMSKMPFDNPFETFEVSGY